MNLPLLAILISIASVLVQFVAFKYKKDGDINQLRIDLSVLEERLNNEISLLHKIEEKIDDIMKDLK